MTIKIGDRLLVDDGVVKTLNVEPPGKFEVSDAKTQSL